MLTYRFIFDEDVGLHSRVKREAKEAGSKRAEVKKAEAGVKEESGERGYASDDECVKEKTL
jgi:hypothetical protein